MAPRKKTVAGTWRGPKPETFSAITWHPANRARHEADYPDRPRFTAAELADWSRIYKRADVEHPKPGKNSFQALVGRDLVGTALVTRQRSILWHSPRAMASSKSSVSGSPTRKSAQSSSRSALVHRALASPVASPETATPPKPSLDRDALEALAWVESGMPESKIGYGPDAPKLSPEQLQEFKPASYVSAPETAPAPQRVKKAVG